MTVNDLLFDFAFGMILTNANIVVAVVMLVRLMRAGEDFTEKKIDLLQDYTMTRINTLHERIDKLEQAKEEGRE